jgi:hypothetical protein
MSRAHLAVQRFTTQPRRPVASFLRAEEVKIGESAQKAAKETTPAVEIFKDRDALGSAANTALL